MNSSNLTEKVNDMSKEIPDSVHYIFGVVYMLLNVVATTGNVVVLYVFFRSKKLHSAIYFMISALCLGDLLMSSVGLTVLSIASFATYWVLGDWGCIAYGTLMTFLGLMQITLLTVIAVTRYIFVVHNNNIGPCSAKVITLLCLLYALGFSMAPLLGWSKFVVEPIGTSCGPNWVGIEWSDVSFNMTLFFLCFLAPLSFILFSYIMIFWKIKKKRIQKKNETYEIHVSTTILFMIVAFLGSWTPYAFMALYIVITKNNQIHPLLAAIPLILAKCAPIWNPYIYFLRDTKFNHECRKMLPILSRLGLWRVNPGSSQDDHVMQLNGTLSRKTSTYV